MPEHDRQRRAAPADDRQTSTAIDGLLGRSQAMLDLKGLVARVAAASSPVVIVGETGTGKEKVARAIHRAGGRHGGPFVPLSCGSVSEASLDSALFGHTGGAVPGTPEARRGVFVEADGGILFLDEVGDMPPLLQTKILRVLQTGELRAVGSETTRRVDVRCIASTREDLQALVDRGKVREDLFFRLNVIPLRVPPLRERREDIGLLVEHFLDRCAPRTGSSTSTMSVTPRALKLLETHPWPGNVRELGNLIERLMVTASGPTIDIEAVRGALTPLAASDPVQSLVAARVSLDALERRYIAGVLRHTQGNKARAAEILGIDLSTLYRREKHRGA
jgi:two-component system, NtrC family, response regulator HydG